MLSTGRSGSSNPDSNKVTIPCSSAIMQAIVEGTGRAADQAAMVERMKRERSEYISSFEGLAPSILKSIA